MTKEQRIDHAYALCRMFGIDHMWRELNDNIALGLITRWEAQSIAEQVRQRIDKEFPKGHRFF